MKTYTINMIQNEMNADGSHWWDLDTLRHFGCRVSRKVYQGEGGMFFVTSEQFMFNDRKYSVRRYDPTTKQINTVGEFNDLTRAQAHNEAARLAGDDGTVTSEAHRVPSDAEQLAIDIKRNGGRASAGAASHLIRLATRYDRMQVQKCNDPVDDAFHAAERLLESKITKAAKRCFCGVKLGGDPRGCVVKLTMPNGETNDFGKEGWCVPI